MKSLSLLVSLLFFTIANGQNVTVKLEAAVKVLEADKKMNSGIIGFHVVNSKTGSVVFSRNGKVGLPAASTQKIITSAAALSILGQDFRFKTELSYDGTIENGTLQGNLFINGFGDPTLGSWRYENCKQQEILSNWISVLQKAGIKKIDGNVVIGSTFPFQPVPPGWAWDDIGNYYGAGSQGINWHENQYDLFVKPGENEGDDVEILSTEPQLQNVTFINQLKTGKRGSGDNSIIFLPPMSQVGYISGTVPTGVKSFKVSGSFPSVGIQLSKELEGALSKAKIAVSGSFISDYTKASTTISESKTNLLYTQYSPILDSINFWFLRKSINLYGEAMIKYLGYQKNNKATTESGLEVVKKFWEEKGLDITSLHMIDGSGLSPNNRVTAEALVQVIQFMSMQKSFNNYYNAFPEINGIKMKSGSIGGVRGFTGRVNGYTFAIIVNNYEGSSSEIVKKIYAVLDVLK